MNHLAEAIKLKNTYLQNGNIKVRHIKEITGKSTWTAYIETDGPVCSRK